MDKRLLNWPRNTRNLSPLSVYGCNLAQVRNFVESVLCDLRESWMRRMSYVAVVQCVCDRPCLAHNAVRCQHDDCLHFLSLDQCLSNKVWSRRCHF